MNKGEDMLFVTGGAGFIGSNFVQHYISSEGESVINLDKLTYAGNVNNLATLEHNSYHIFVQGDIGHRPLVKELLQKHQPRMIIHFAAETHVDRSTHHPESFIHTNILSSFAFLDEALSYWKHLPSTEKHHFRFLNVSTEEVYGLLGPEAPSNHESAPYAPDSPYAASKASFDHLVRAYHTTYGFPTITTYSPNNFGPYQFPEKLIPLIIVNALQGKSLPVYGDGQQIRQWIYVGDHCEALKLLLHKGIPGSSYNIDSGIKCTHLYLVKTLCKILDELKSDSPYKPHESLIKHVKDKPGHDRRYSLDGTKLQQELNWKPKGSFEENLRKTVLWYLDHLPWLENVISGEYRDWILAQYHISSSP
jgi:dTDP-glucose 4,6-dehydratase